MIYLFTYIFYCTCVINAYVFKFYLHLGMDL